MEKFRDTIKSAIIEYVEQNELIALLICEYSGYSDLIGYKFGYTPNDHLFDTRVSTCAPFGFLSGQRVLTIDGTAICIGVAPSTIDNSTEYELYFDLIDHNTNMWKRLCYPSFKKAQFIQKNFALIDGFVNVWGQDWHSFSSAFPSFKKWWNDDKYLIGNPLNMPTGILPLPSAAPIPTKPNNVSYDESLWFWASSTVNLSQLSAYEKTVCERIEKLDIGRSFMYDDYDSMRVYLIIKTAPQMGYQINVGSRYVRRVLKGSAAQKSQLKKHTKQMYHKSDAHLSWFWEGDEANMNIWNKYEEGIRVLINNHKLSQYGSAIPHSYMKQEHSFKYEIIRLSETEGIQRNVVSEFSRRIVREDHDDINVDTMISSAEYVAKLKQELMPSDDDNEEKYEYIKDEPNLTHPTSNIATLATETSVPLTPKEEYIKIQTKETKKQYTQKKQAIAPHADKSEDAFVKVKKKREWRWTKALMYTGYIFTRALSLTDLCTDLYLLWKAQANQVILLTIALFISIFSPYVLSYSSGIKLFIFRKTFDHLQGFKKIFLLLYLLPTGFLYFIFIDIIDSLFTVYKWFLYNVLCKNDKSIKETEELLAQQLGMDRMNWEGFKRQKTVGQLMFETIPQVTLQGLIAFNVGGSLLKLSGTSISKRDLYLSIGSATVNSIGQITKLYLESIAVQESFIQYALTCMMGRVGWVPFRHKIQRIFTSKNINTSEKQNANNTVLNISSANIETTPQKNIVATKSIASDVEEISFNIKYDIPFFTNCLHYFGFKGKRKLQGTIEYDFSTVTIRYLIATLLVLQNAKTEESKHQKSNSIKIIFGQSLRLLGVHDIALLLETCKKKNISLENVREMVKWERAFEISTIKDRKDPRLISYSRDEQGRPLIIGLYLSGYDPDKYIFRELLRNDVPHNLEDASGETIVYHLIRCMDYAGIRELFKTKYEKDEKRSNIYLNIYNRSGYSPLYLALRQHIHEIAQREMEKIDEKDDDKEEEDAFVLDEPPAKAPKATSKVTFNTDTIVVKEEKVEEDPADVEIAPRTEQVAGETVEMAPITKEDENPAIAPIAKAPIAPKAPKAPMAPIAKQAPIAPKAPIPKALLASIAKSKTNIGDNLTKPLSMIESIRVQKYTRQWNDGESQEAIEAEMTSNGVPISLLQRYIHNKKGKKYKRKKKKKTLTNMNEEIEASTKQSTDPHETLKQALSRKLRMGPKPTQLKEMRKKISDPGSNVGAMKRRIQEREAISRRKAQHKMNKREKKQKSSNCSLEETLIELSKTERFAAETIMNCMRFKLHDKLWNNLMALFEHYEIIRCVYDCIAACYDMLISTKCKHLDSYMKMARLGSTLVQIENKMKKDKYLSQQQQLAFIKAYKLLDDVQNDLVDFYEQKDVTIAMIMKENLRNFKNKYEIFKIVPTIMDAQYMMKLELSEEKENTLRTFKAKETMPLHEVMDYVNAFEKDCDIDILKRDLNLKLCASELKDFAPNTGSYKDYLYTREKEPQTLSQLIKFIQEKELEKIKANLVSFAYNHLRGYYLDYFADKKENKQAMDIADDDDDDDDEYEVDLFNDRQWMYQILLSHNSDPNFECNSGGLSPLAYVLTNLFEHIYVANDLVSRGAKLQAKESHIMVNVFVHSAFQQKAELYLDICIRICRKSDIHLSNIRDQNGNNPMHLAVLRSDETDNKKHDKKQKKKQINHKFIRQKQKALQLLNERHPKWLAQKNNNDMYPLTIAVKFRDLDSTMCLGAISAVSLQKYIKSIVSHREFVMDLIIWVVTILLTAHNSAQKSNVNYDKLMEVELLFSVFDYNVSFKWPSTYIKPNEIIHYHEFQKDNLDLKSFSLISYCYDKRLYSVLQLITTEFNIMRHFSAKDRVQVKEMNSEVQAFTGQMFVERKTQQDQLKENILDKIKKDMLLENDFGSPDITDVASKFMSDDDDIYEDDDDDIDDEHEDRKKAVSWIEVIYSTTVEGLSTADFITDIFILRDLWVSNNLWWTTFMLSLLIAPYLVCYSALGSLIQHRMNFMYLTMSIDEGKSVRCGRKCKWVSFNLLVLLLMTPLCIGYFIIIDIVFMIYVMFATFVFFISCTHWNIGDSMDDWVFKKIFGLNRMQIIGYRRLRTLSQLFFETIPQIFLQLRILWQIEWAGKQNEFQINSQAIMWSVGFAVLHLIFEAAIISLDSAASKMKFIHYAIVCLGARLDWIPFSHLFSKKAREIQDVIDKKDYKQPIDIKQQYFESENEDFRQQLMDNKHEPFNYEEIASGLLGLRYKLEFQFSNESMNKLAETLTYLPSPTLPIMQISNRLLKNLLNSILLEPLMMEVIIGAESCRNVDIFSVAELYRSTVHRVHLNITEIDMYRVIQNSHISSGHNSDDNKRKILSLLMEEFINYGELFVVEWLSQKHLGLNKEPQSIKSWIILNSLGGVNGIQLIDSDLNSNIEGGKFEILRKYYTEGLVFGLECKLAKVIYKYIYQCLQRALQESTYFYVALFILWYTRCNIYNHCCSLGCCKIKNELRSIQSHEKIVANSPKGDAQNITHSSSMKYYNIGGSNSNYVDSLLDKLHKYLPQIVEIGDWEISYQLTECFAILKVHLEELLLNQLKKSTNNKQTLHHQHEDTKRPKAKKMKGKKAMMWRVATTMDFDKTASHSLNVNDEYTQRVLGLDFYKLAEKIHQSDIDLLQAIIDTPIHKLHSFPLHSFFVPKLEALDILVTELRMIYQYNKYIVCSKKYRNKDVCYMGENGKIVNDLHLTQSSGTKSIYISMNELHKFLPVMHLGITRLRFHLKNVQSSFSGEDDEKKNSEDNKKDIGQIKLWWINPIEALDKKLSTNINAKKHITDTLEWNRVYLKNAPITFKIINNAYFDVSIVDIFGLSMYNRRLIDYGKIAPLYLELAVKYGHNLHCDAIELEVEFIKTGMRKISVTDEEKPIHRFCKNNSLKLLKYMVPTYTDNKTFDINATKKRTQETPLHIICSSNVINYEIVELLINNRVKINKQNKDKDTALDIIQKKKNKNPNTADVNHNVEQLLIKNKAVFNTQKPKKTDARLKPYLNMLKIRVPIWAVIQYMKKQGVDRGLIGDIERIQLEREEAAKNGAKWSEKD